MRIASLFHVPFEKLGFIEDWIIRRGHVLNEFHLYDDPRLPVPGEFDLLIIMGGPMSVHDKEVYPWMQTEIRLMEECIESGTHVLGICLGAQLIASILGSKVVGGKYLEIGWFPVSWSQDEEVKIIFPGLPEKSTVFHWHGEMFELPPGSVALASSAITPCQGFLFRRHVIGLQFHLEVKPENIALMLAYAGEKLPGGPFVQDSDSISGGLENITENEKIMETFLTYFENQTGRAYVSH